MDSKTGYVIVVSRNGQVDEVLLHNGEFPYTKELAHEVADYYNSLDGNGQRHDVFALTADKVPQN